MEIWSEAGISRVKGKFAVELRNLAMKLNRDWRSAASESSCSLSRAKSSPLQ